MTLHPVEHAARGIVVAGAAAIGFDGTIGVIAQAVPGINDAFLMQLAEKGGGWVVLLIVLFFYRRDYQRLTNSDTEVRKELLATMAMKADSEQRMAVALAETTEVMRAFKAFTNGESYPEDRREGERRRDDEPRTHDRRR
jgi:hypothetical protein